LTSGPDRELDWSVLRMTLRRHLARRAGAGDREYLDDLVQEASIRLLRATRRGPVEQIEGLAATIAHRTWVDFIRRRTRCRRVFSPGERFEATVGPEAFPLGDPRDRLRFVVLELFGREGSTRCAELARAYFAETDWKQVAGALELSHDAGCSRVRGPDPGGPGALIRNRPAGGGGAGVFRV
jgi:DNA-directed RNA polymerase specialized sigma24 family protein